MANSKHGQPADESDPKIPAFHRSIIRRANALGFFPTKAQAKAIARNYCNPPRDADLDAEIRKGMAMGPALVKDQAKADLIINHQELFDTPRINGLQLYVRIQRRVSRAVRFKDEADFLRILWKCVDDREMQVFEGGRSDRADALVVGHSRELQELKRHI
jgi:hypothetical protein